MSHNHATNKNVLNSTSLWPQGPRNCLGQHFALLESRIVLALLVKRFKFIPTGKENPEKSQTIPECLRDGLNVLIE